MTVVDEDFCWWRDPQGYEILKGRPGDTSPDADLLSRIDGGDTVVSKSTPLRYQVCAERQYVDFANIKSEADVLDFCKQHGIPTHPARPAFVYDILKNAQLFRHLKDTMRRDTLPIRINEIFARGSKSSFLLIIREL
jgi:hypothetical protein